MGMCWQIGFDGMNSNRFFKTAFSTCKYVSFFLMLKGPSVLH